MKRPLHFLSVHVSQQLISNQNIYWKYQLWELILHIRKWLIVRRQKSHLIWNRNRDRKHVYM